MNLIDPDVIVVGGGMSNVASLYDDCQRPCAPYVFSDSCTTPIVKARYGGLLRGARRGWLWLLPVTLSHEGAQPRAKKAFAAFWTPLPTSASDPAPAGDAFGTWVISSVGRAADS